jgi:hypothetical protein
MLLGRIDQLAATSLCQISRAFEIKISGNAWTLDPLLSIISP